MEAGWYGICVEERGERLSNVSCARVDPVPSGSIGIGAVFCVVSSVESGDVGLAGGSGPGPGGLLWWPDSILAASPAPLSSHP